MLGRSQQAEFSFQGKPVLTSDRHPIDLFHSSRQGTQEADNQSDNTKYQCASTMVCQDVHQNIKRHYIARHKKNQQQELANSQKFAAETAHQKFTSISHAVDLRVTELELADDIACVP